ncbi:MAG TPA: heavy metal translocating P-type ATPase [Candidatus Paceibacterota bacterium]
MARTHDMHTGHHTEDFLKKFWISLVLIVPIFFYSEMAMMLFGLHGPEFIGSQYVLLALGTIVYFYCGWVFLAGAYRELRARLPGMMTLIAIAITTAYLYSALSIVAGTSHDLLFELSSLIAIMLLGHWIEMRSVQGAKGALKELAKLLPDTAEVIRNGTTSTMPLDKLVEGDIVLVRPGAKIPADGVVAEGSSDLDESIITGESRPVHKSIGIDVIAGSMNGDGSLKIQVTKIGEHTFLAGVMRLVVEAESSKSRLQMLSDRAAYYLTLVALGAGGVTFIAWLMADAGLVFATERVVSVLVIACPHALGLAVPLVASISTTMAARSGLLVRRRLALEAARNIDVVLFDKTGTLTRGEFGVDTIFPAEGSDEREVLQLAASVNANSEHALARAIVAEAKKRDIELSPISNFVRVAGQGAKATIDGSEASIGSETLFGSDVKIPGVVALEKQGKTVVYVGRGGTVIGAIALADIIRPESRAALSELKGLGVKVAMITGDSEDVAAWVAKELGVDQYFARVLPHEKAEKVKLLQSQGQKVAMVGDGVNDAPALTQADLGIAIGAGTNVAIESAGIILVRSDPRDIPKIIRLSKLTYAKMIQNLFWATGYNVVAIPLAAGVLYTQGVILQPALAAVFMSLSTVIVAINAVLLRRRVL